MPVKLNHIYQIFSEITSDNKRQVMLVESLFPDFKHNFIEIQHNEIPCVKILKIIKYKIHREKRIAYKVNFFVKNKTNSKTKQDKDIFVLEWQILKEINEINSG